MELVRLPRRGNDDLVFMGEEIAGINDNQWVDRSLTKWKLTLYKTEEGTFVLNSVFQSDYPREVYLQSARAFDSAHEIYIFFQNEGHGQTENGEELLKKAAKKDLAFSSKTICIPNVEVVHHMARAAA